LLQSEQVTRVYLEDLPDPPPEKLGLHILRLIASPQTEAMERAQRLLPQVRASAEPAERQRELIELIETVIVYQYPKKSRRELEKMLQVNDFRETKVYQEALEEGIEKGIEKGIETVALQMLEKKVPLKKIAELTGLSAATVKRLQKKQGK
jgi:predicted transposase/invertase (TIGR01784 family)